MNDRPVMLASPVEVIPVGAAAAVDPATTPTGNGTFHVDAVNATTNVTNVGVLQRATDPGLKVGDILLLSYEVGAAGDSFGMVASIKTMTTPWTATATVMVFEVSKLFLIQ